VFFGGLLFVFDTAAFNQFSVINALLYYAPKVFGMSGSDSDTALLQSIPIGLMLVISTGAVVWVFIAEIFPNRVRAKGIGPGHSFMFFAVCMVAQAVFVWLVLPETKGVSLEQLEKRLAQRYLGKSEM